MQSQFIKVCTALGVVGVAGTAMAGGTTRFDVSFSDVDIFAGVIDGNQQVTATADPGRYFSGFGWSNVDVDICWNDGSSYSGWASEVNFAMTMNDGTETALFALGSPFAGDDTGTDTVGTCANRQALAELPTDFAPFTYQVDPDTGDVTTGMFSVWDDGTGLRHSFCNTADFFFVLAGEIPAGCDGATGSCAEVHAEPGCADLSCCSLTCDPNVGGDSFCCTSTWDSTCVDLAVALCGIFQYSCDAPAYANDCATAPTMLANGDTIAFDTTGANTDGPDQAECGSGYEDLPIWSDLWYMIEVESDSDITATCCNTAYFDTKIAIYDAGPIGTTFDPGNLPDSFLICNEDCADDAGGFFTSEAVALGALGGRQYLVRVGGYQQAVGTGDLTVSWEDPAPQLPAPECATPGSTVVSQITTPIETLTVSGGVWCGAGAANVLARSYPASMFGGAFDVSCVDFGWFMNDEAYMPATINLYVQDAASPLAVTSQELVATTEFGLFGAAGYTISSQSFDSPVAIDLADGEFLMIEINMARQLQDPAGEGYGGFFGVILADTDGTEGYISCGGDYFGSMTDIGFGDYQPYLSLNGESGGSTPCPGDFNDDGVVNGADFGSILAAWGPCPGCPEDLNGDGEVNGADVGGILAAWGACP